MCTESSELLIDAHKITILKMASVMGVFLFRPVLSLNVIRAESEDAFYFRLGRVFSLQRSLD